jgi:predicted RNA-binding Zn-ribbon protein involved in translation (DUF1610 family)
MDTPEEIAADLCDDGQCPFCGADLESRSFLPRCDDEEIYCPECGYVDSIA